MVFVILTSAHNEPAKRSSSHRAGLILVVHRSAVKVLIPSLAVANFLPSQMDLTESQAPFGLRVIYQPVRTCNNFGVTAMEKTGTAINERGPRR